MRRTFAAAAALAVTIATAPPAGAVQPYLSIETGAVSREVVEESASIQGFKAAGTVASTRLLATLGLEIARGLRVYAQGGAAAMSIDQFNGFDGSFEGAYGGGVRLSLLLPYGAELFADASVLHTTSEDIVQAEFACTAANGCTAAAPGGAFLRLVDETIEWDEYTLLLGAAGRYGPYVPYAGVRLSMIDGEDRIHAAADANFSSDYLVTADLKEQENFGVFLGTDVFLDPSRRTSLNLEVSLIDQDSIRVAIRRAF